MRFVRLLALAFLLASPLSAQGQRGPPTEVRSALSRPDLAGRIREWIVLSGLTPAQVRSRLVAAGYSATLLDGYIAGEAGASAATTSEVLQAARALGLSGPDDELPIADSVSGLPGSLRTDLPRLRTANELPIFGLDVFQRVSTQFQPVLSGPVDASYRLGTGDVLVLIVTGDVELAQTLQVNREGFVILPQVGQLHVANLTLGQLEGMLFSRLSRVYPGISRGANATTRFQITVSRLRTNQVYVIGNVARPGSYQIASVGTVLNALYLAGGPTATGSFRSIQVRRGSALVDSLDLYDYLLHGDNAHDVRLETGDVVFVPTRGLQVAIGGAVTRPGIYELAAHETLQDLVSAAGGFEPTALRRRIQIERILPLNERMPDGGDRVVLDVAAATQSDSLAPAFPLTAGDRVTVFSVSDRRRNVVTVRGNVWLPGTVGFTLGMRLSHALRLAGGAKRDVYLGQILISRLNSDSTRSQLRSAFRDSSGVVSDDLPLREDDEITVFSRTSFRPHRYVVITGAVRRAGRVPYREGMTLRDAILEADGLTEDAFLGEVEIARLPEDRSRGSLALTRREGLDSTYLFDRDPNGEYRGPPGLKAAGSGAAEVLLQPYDNILVLRQPDWELQRTVVITGQVRFPGRYSLRTKTERVSDLITRAGGLAPESYAPGAALYRVFHEHDPQLVAISRLDAQGDSSARSSTRVSLEPGSSSSRRVGVDLSRVLRTPSARENVILQAGDSLHVPEFDPTVRILGAVNAPSAVVHHPGWNADDYVSASGGYGQKADSRRVYVLQPSGYIESLKRRLFLPDGQPEPQPGAVVIVPERDAADRKDWAGLLGSLAQILAGTVAIIIVATR